VAGWLEVRQAISHSDREGKKRAPYCYAKARGGAFLFQKLPPRVRAELRRRAPEKMAICQRLLLLLLLRSHRQRNGRDMEGDERGTSADIK